MTHVALTPAPGSMSLGWAVPDALQQLQQQQQQQQQQQAQLALEVMGLRTKLAFLCDCIQQRFGSSLSVFQVK